MLLLLHCEQPFLRACQSRSPPRKPLAISVPILGEYILQHTTTNQDTALLEASRCLACPLAQLRAKPPTFSHPLLAEFNFHTNIHDNLVSLEARDSSSVPCRSRIHHSSITPGARLLRRRKSTGRSRVLNGTFSSRLIRVLRRRYQRPTQLDSGSAFCSAASTRNRDSFKRVQCPYRTIRLLRFSGSSTKPKQNTRALRPQQRPAPAIKCLVKARIMQVRDRRRSIIRRRPPTRPISQGGA